MLFLSKSWCLFKVTSLQEDLLCIFSKPLYTVGSIWSLEVTALTLHTPITDAQVFFTFGSVQFGSVNRTFSTLYVRAESQNLSLVGHYNEGFNQSEIVGSDMADKSALVVKSVNSDFNLAVRSKKFWQAKTHFLSHHDVCYINRFANFPTRDQWSNG